MYNTKQQKLLEDFFLKNKEESFKAVDLISVFEKDMNKATIYRRVQSLEEQGYIRRVYNPKGKTCEYQYACNCDRHLHLVCQCCNKIIHLECEKATGFVEHILTQHSFVIDKNNSAIYGLCKDCQNA